LRLFAFILVIIAIPVMVLASNGHPKKTITLEKYKQTKTFDPTKYKVVGMASTKSCAVVRKINKAFLIRHAKKTLPKGTAFMIVQAHVHNITIGHYTGEKDPRQARCIIWWQYPVNRAIKNGTILTITKS